MPNDFLAAQLKVPEVATVFLKRQRMNTLLSESLTKKLTVLTGQAGSGKSTEVAAYIRQSNLLEQTIWLSLSTECNEPTLFWHYLVEGFRPFLSGASRQKTVDLLASYHEKTPRAFLIAFLNQIKEESLYLILDDLHFIKNSKLLSDLEFFLKQLPSTIHCVLISRQDPPFYLAQWVVADELSHITNQELTLTEQEALTFIDQHQKQPLPKTAKQEMINFTEGWLAGLHLLICDWNRRSTQPTINQQADKGLVYDYLRGEVYRDLLETEQEYLVLTSQLPYMTEELGQTLFPELNQKALLNNLLTEGLVCQFSDEKQLFFRYHHLFQDFLTTQVNKVMNERLEAVLRQSLTYYFATDDLVSGVSLSLALGEYALAITGILKLDNPLKKLYFIKKIPHEVAVSDFELTFQKFFFHYTNLELEECAILYELALSEQQNKADFTLLKGLDYLIKEGNLTLDAPVLTDQVIMALEVTPLTRGLMVIKNVSVLFYQGSFHKGVKQMATFDYLFKAIDNDFLTFYALNIKAQLFEELGFFNRALSCYTDIRQLLITSSNLKELSRFFEVSYTVSILGIYLKQLKLPEAAECLALMEEKWDSQLHHQAFLYNQISYSYLVGNTELAYSQLEELLTFSIAANAEPYMALINHPLSQGQLTKQIEDDFLATYRLKIKTNVEEDLFQIRLLLKSELLAEAKTLLVPLLAMLRQQKWPLKLVEGNLLAIKLALRDPNGLREAQNLYREAIYYACSDDIKVPFYIAQDTLKELFKHDYSAITLSLTGLEKKFHQELVSTWQLLGKQLLTEREVEVLTEIEKSATTKQIAHSLFISEATVKTHILNIYRKLAVNSRVSAVKKGIELEILTNSN